MKAPLFVASCKCGKTEWAASAKPIASVICYCDDCQAGAQQIEALTGAAHIARDDGGTPYVVLRRDRFQRISGTEPLVDLRLREGSPTKRVVASCCNTAIFLDFEKGHWVSVYRERIQTRPPEPTMAIQTRFRRPDAGAPLEVPAFSSFAPAFLWKLLLACLAMALGR
jgi:hypothetical protein